MTRRARATLAAGVLALAGCHTTRAEPAPEPPRTAWRPARAEDLPGVWESRVGEVVPDGTILRVFYIFVDDGRYQAVAIMVPHVTLQFLALVGEGRWTVDDRGLDLHHGDGPTPIEASGERLRLRIGDSVLELDRLPWVVVPRSTGVY